MQRGLEIVRRRNNFTRRRPQLNPFARFQHREHLEYVRRLDAREQRVLMAKIFRIGSASGVLSEI